MTPCSTSSLGRSSGGVGCPPSARACAFLLKTLQPPSASAVDPLKEDARAGALRGSFRTKRGRHGPVTTRPFQGIGRGLHGDGARGLAGLGASLAPTLAQA